MATTAISSVSYSVLQTDGAFSSTYTKPAGAGPQLLHISMILGAGLSFLVRRQKSWVNRI